MRFGRNLSVCTWIMCIGLGLISSARAQVSREVEVPVVACPVDGQVGPQALKGPRSIRATLPEGQTTRLAYYRGLQGHESVLVLGPRGWKCIGLYGSNGDTMFIVPPTVNPKQDGRFQGPVIEVRYRYGGTSGRTSVASTAGPLFKAASPFIDEVEANFPSAEKYRRAPWPNEQVTRVNDRLVTYVDPPGVAGTGTQGRLAAGTLAIHGLAALAESSDLVALAIRLEAVDAVLISTIISDFRATATRLLKPVPAAQPSVPTKPASQPTSLSALAGIWVPVELYPQGCAPSTAWIASTDQAMRIEPRAIHRFERHCSVEFTAPQPDGSLRVGTRCNFANQIDAPIMTLSLVQGKLTLREKSMSKTYARCQR